MPATDGAAWASAVSGGKWLLGMAGGLLASGVAAGVASLGVLAVFLLLRWQYVPAELTTLPVHLQYYQAEAKAGGPAAAPLMAAAPLVIGDHAVGILSGDGLTVSIAAAAAAGAAAGVAAGAGVAGGCSAPPPHSASACADVAITPDMLPAEPVDADVDLVLRVPHGSEESRPSPQVMCSLELLDVSGSEVLSSSRPLLLPNTHWAIRLCTAALWAPLIALGLVSDLQRDAVVPLVEHVRLGPPLSASISQARVCLRPPLATYRAELRVRLRLTGWLRGFVQRHPMFCCLLIFLVTSTLTLVGLGCMFCALYVVMLKGGAAAPTAAGGDAVRLSAALRGSPQSQAAGPDPGGGGGGKAGSNAAAAGPCTSREAEADLRDGEGDGEDPADGDARTPPAAQRLPLPGGAVSEAPRSAGAASAAPPAPPPSAEELELAPDHRPRRRQCASSMS